MTFVPAVPHVRRGGLRPRRALVLRRFLARAPRRLARTEGLALLHVRLGRLAAHDAVVGLAGAERLRDEVVSRAVTAAGRGALVGRTGDVLLVLAPHDVVAGLPALLDAPTTSPDRDGGLLTVRPGLHCGTAVAVPGSALDDLLDAAAAAAAEAEARCETVVVAQDAHREACADRRTVERLLRRAVPDGLLRLHYQPLVDLETGRVTGAEALVRLQDGDRLVPPDAFVPLAEQTGLVVELGTWVLREACRQLAVWRLRLPDLQSVAVNVSACQVARPDFADVVLGALADRGLPGRALVLELTESVLLDAGPVALAQLERLQAHGVRTGVDDFGTGYASLTYLRRLPVSFVKVDRSFVSGLPGSAPDGAVVRAVLGLAADLGLECIAEGIETTGQLDALRGLGAVRGQGYLLSRPVPAARFEATLVGSLLPTAGARVPLARAGSR